MHWSFISIALLLSLQRHLNPNKNVLMCKWQIADVLIRSSVDPGNSLLCVRMLPNPKIVQQGSIIVLYLADGFDWFDSYLFNLEKQLVCLHGMGV